MCSPTRVCRSGGVTGNTLEVRVVGDNPSSGVIKLSTQQVERYIQQAKVHWDNAREANLRRDVAAAEKSYTQAISSYRTVALTNTDAAACLELVLTEYDKFVLQVVQPDIDKLEVLMSQARARSCDNPVESCNIYAESSKLSNEIIRRINVNKDEDAVSLLTAIKEKSRAIKRELAQLAMKLAKTYNDNGDYEATITYCRIVTCNISRKASANEVEDNDLRENAQAMLDATIIKLANSYIAHAIDAKKRGDNVGSVIWYRKVAAMGLPESCENLRSLALRELTEIQGNSTLLS